MTHESMTDRVAMLITDLPPTSSTTLSDFQLPTAALDVQLPVGLSVGLLVGRLAYLCEKFTLEFQMVNITYLPSYLCDSSDGNDTIYSSYSSDSSGSSGSSDSSDCSDCSDRSDQTFFFTQFFFHQKSFFFTKKTFFSNFFSSFFKKTFFFTKKNLSSNCDETQKLKLLNMELREKTKYVLGLPRGGFTVVGYFFVC